MLRRILKLSLEISRKAYYFFACEACACINTGARAMLGYYVVLITAPVDKAQHLADFIIENKLGACVNVVPEVNSTYWWKGNIEKDKESLLVVKTSAKRFEELLKKVKEVHPYTVPEIIALPIVAGNEDYLRWIDDSLG